MTSQNVLYVRNIEQAALMLELDGQLSDGHWENAKPSDHWHPWCDAHVVVADEGRPVGRNFNAPKTNYNLTSRELLDVVEKRALGIVRIARGCGLRVASALEFSVDCETGRITWNSSLITEMARMGIRCADVDAAITDTSYTLADMRRDLNDLKVIFKTRIA